MNIFHLTTDDVHSFKESKRCSLFINDKEYEYSIRVQNVESMYEKEKTGSVVYLIEPDNTPTWVLIEYEGYSKHVSITSFKKGDGGYHAIVSVLNGKVLDVERAKLHNYPSMNSERRSVEGKEIDVVGLIREEA